MVQNMLGTFHYFLFTRNICTVKTVQVCLSYEKHVMGNLKAINSFSFSRIHISSAEVQCIQNQIKLALNSHKIKRKLKKKTWRTKAVSGINFHIIKSLKFASVCYGCVGNLSSLKCSKLLKGLLLSFSVNIVTTVKIRQLNIRNLSWVKFNYDWLKAATLLSSLCCDSVQYYYLTK